MVAGGFVPQGVNLAIQKAIVIAFLHLSSCAVIEFLRTEPPLGLD